MLHSFDLYDTESPPISAYTQPNFVHDLHPSTSNGVVTEHPLPCSNKSVSLRRSSSASDIRIRKKRRSSNVIPETEESCESTEKSQLDSKFAAVKIPAFIYPKSLYDEQAVPRSREKDVLRDILVGYAQLRSMDPTEIELSRKMIRIKQILNLTVMSSFQSNFETSASTDPIRHVHAREANISILLLEIDPDPWS